MEKLNVYNSQFTMKNGKYLSDEQKMNVQRHFDGFINVQGMRNEEELQNMAKEFLNNMSATTESKGL